jgi:predicted ribosomally synthesized peptide with nif11-like leader
MSHEAVGKFVEAINQSPGLKEKCRKVVDGSDDPAGFVALGRANGFEFSEEDARSYFGILLGQPGPGELGDQDLAKVAGGFGGADLLTARYRSQAIFQNLKSTPSWVLQGVGSPP